MEIQCPLFQINNFKMVTTKHGAPSVHRDLCNLPHKTANSQSQPHMGPSLKLSINLHITQQDCKIHGGSLLKHHSLPIQSMESDSPTGSNHTYLSATLNMDRLGENMALRTRIGRIKTYQALHFPAFDRNAQWVYCLQHPSSFLDRSGSHW